MKRFVLALACLALAVPMWAKTPRAHTSAVAATTTINGTPLTIVLGDDTTMQVYNSNVPGSGQFYPSDSAPADAGVFVSVLGTVYGLFNTPYTPVSLSPVTGTGTAGDPFTVVIVEDVGVSLRMTETVTYVNGSAGADISLSFSAAPPPPPPMSPSVPDGTGVPFDVFIGADLYLADNDHGFPFATPGNSAGGHAANSGCTTQLQYSIQFLATTPASGYSANFYSTVWSEIDAGALSNTVAPGCLDDGAALSWHGVFGGTPVVIDTGVSFTGQAIPVGPTVNVPTLSAKALAALGLMLAAVGYALARRTSLGA